MKTTKVNNSLDSFQLEYEEMEIKVPKVKSKVVTQPAKIVKTDAVKRKVNPSAKARLLASFKARTAQGRSAFNDIKSKMRKPKKPSKLSKKAQLERKKSHRDQQIRGIIGIGMLFVVVSIAYSTFVTRTFVDSSASVVALVPQVAFALYILFKAFSKIYK